MSPRSLKTKPHRTLVLGLGNPILSDDAVGILVAREMESLLACRQDVEVREASLGGFDVLDLLLGFGRVFLIDSIKTGGGKVGSIYRLCPDDLPLTARISAIHEISLPVALSLGRRMGLEMPEEVIIYAVEVEDNTTFGLDLSPPVRAAAHELVNRLASEVMARSC